MSKQVKGQVFTNPFTDPTQSGAPTCQRCHKADRRGLANIRGLLLCGLCELIAKARRSR